MNQTTVSDDELLTHPVPESLLNDPLAYASNPESDPTYLGYFVRTSKDPEVLAALARNPSTMPVHLERLWLNEPAAVLENPIVFLWDFTKPGSAAKRVPKRVQFLLYQHLISQPEFDPHPEIIDPKHLVYYLDRTEKHSFTPPLHLLVRDERPSVRLSLLKNCVKVSSAAAGAPVAFPPEAVEALAEDPSGEVALALAEAIAESRLCPDPFDTAFLARVGRLLLKKREVAQEIAPLIANWPCLTAELIESLATEAFDSLLAILAAHPQASESFQRRMAGHTAEIVRAGVATSTRLEDLIQKLAKDPSSTVRAGLATSPRITPEIQRTLFANKDSRILLGLLENPLTIPDLIRAISKLPYLAIAERLRRHPNTPADILATLPPPFQLAIHS